MDTQDVRRGFFDAVRKIDKPIHVQEELIEDTPEQAERTRNRKYFTYVFTDGERYVGRRER